jgi:hypothetical protein
MDLNTLMLIVLVVVLLIQGRPKRRYLPATPIDWFVIFDVDAEKKLLILWFYPVVGYRLEKDAVTPITSRPSITAKLSARRPAKKVKDEMWGVSVSFGRWARDDALFDESGNPEMADNSTFSSIVEGYLLGEFELHYGTTIPLYYQQVLANVWRRVKKNPRKAERVSDSAG